MKHFFAEIKTEHKQLLNSLIGKKLESIFVEENNSNEYHHSHYKSFNYVFMKIDGKLYSLELWKGEFEPEFIANGENQISVFSFQEVSEVNVYYKVELKINQTIKTIEIVKDKLRSYDDKEYDNLYTIDTGFIFICDDLQLIIKNPLFIEEQIEIDAKKWMQSGDFINWKEQIDDLFDEEPVPFKIAASRLIQPLETELKCVNQCPVCGFKVFEYDNSHDICPVCKWEDDGVQNDEPDFCGGANKLSLNQYKARFDRLLFIQANINPMVDAGAYDTEESENYILQNESELVYLMFKDRNKNVIIGDHYGDPMGFFISKNEKWACSYGEGLIVYFLREPFSTFDEMKIIEPQWMMFGRDIPGEPVYVSDVVQTGDWEIEVTLDDSGEKIKFVIPHN